MNKSDRKKEMAIRVWSLVILPVFLAGSYIYNKSFGINLIIYAVIVLSIAFIGSKLLFGLENKNQWIYEKRRNVYKSKFNKNVVMWMAAVITIFMVRCMSYIDHVMMTIISCIAGVLLAIAEFITSSKNIEECNEKTYDDDWWKESQTNGFK